MARFGSHTDDVLFELLKNGDGDAFTEIYNRYWDKLYFLAYSHLRRWEAAEEIVQEVFLALWGKRSQLDIASAPVYLAAMTRYAVYHHLAKQKRYQEREGGRLKVEYGTAVEEMSLDNKLLLEIIGKLANQLPEKCRLVFIYNKLLDQPLEKVARDMN